MSRQKNKKVMALGRQGGKDEHNLNKNHCLREGLTFAAQNA